MKQIDNQIIELRNEIAKKCKHTKLGYDRIRRNLNVCALTDIEIENYCVKIINSAKIIEKVGKNYYVKSDEYNSILTINSFSFTIITAKKMNELKNVLG